MIARSNTTTFKPCSQWRQATNGLPGHYPFYGGRSPEAPPPWSLPLQPRHLFLSFTTIIIIDIIDHHYLPYSHHAFTSFLLSSVTSSRMTSPYDTLSNNSLRITSGFSITVPISVNGAPWSTLLQKLHLHHASIFTITHIPSVPSSCIAQVSQTTPTTSHHPDSQPLPVPTASTLNTKLVPPFSISHCRQASITISVTHLSPASKSTH